MKNALGCDMALSWENVTAMTHPCRIDQLADVASCRIHDASLTWEMTHRVASCRIGWHPSCRIIARPLGRAMRHEPGHRTADMRHMAGHWTVDIDL